MTLFPPDLPTPPERGTDARQGDGTRPSVAAAASPGPREAARLCSVAIEQSLDRTLTYVLPRQLAASVSVGMRVRVPLGRRDRPAIGYVVGFPEAADVATEKLKPVLAVADSRVLLTPGLLELARWVSRYYICPLGTVIDTMLPSAVKKLTGLGRVTRVRLAVPHDEAQRVLETLKRPKRRAVLARLLQVPPGESIELTVLARESGTRPATVRKFAAEADSVLRLETGPDLGTLQLDVDPAAGQEADLPLNSEQQAALDQILRRLDRLSDAPNGFEQCLLMGVTGSGKTEVYLQAIRRVVAQGRQAIVLVPEIALTPQTVKRFTGRFPRVCVLHSGLTATERHRQWHTILSGRADVVVGARSAVFAPVPRLGMIVVDEEHEASYKQDQAPRYHARDLAIKRAQLEHALCLLGSATPSLESYHRASATQSLLRLPHRVRGIQMPTVELVDMKQVARLRKGVHLLSPRLETLLRSTLAAGQQAILLLNRRGYSSFVYCAHCNEALQCRYCDAALTYHRNTGPAVQPLPATHRQALHTGQLHCHYCLAVNPLPERCPTCGRGLSLFGLGTQRVEEELLKKLPGLRFARVDSDTMRTGADYVQTLERFGRGELQLLLGTQMIAKGLDYPNVTLVGVISGDTALSLPDFRAAERTFQLITQVAGRAGRGNAPGRVILQTFNPDDPAITAAIRQDYEGFASRELQQRQAVGLPPFHRLCRIILRDQDDAHLQRHVALLAEAVQSLLPRHPQVKLRGPMPCAINRIAGYHRANLLLSAPRAADLQRLLHDLRTGGHLKPLDRIAVDVDPVHLL
ncbi:MAG: primosomal protein N' [Tepidisphaerales bacterium]